MERGTGNSFDPLGLSRSSSGLFVTRRRHQAGHVFDPSEMTASALGCQSFVGSLERSLLEDRRAGEVHVDVSAKVDGIGFGEHAVMNGENFGDIFQRRGGRGRAARVWFDSRR